MGYSLFDTDVASLSSTGRKASFRPYALPEKYKTHTLNFYKLYTNYYTEDFSTDIGIAWNISVNDVTAIENFMITLYGEKEFIYTFFPMNNTYHNLYKKV